MKPDQEDPAVNKPQGKSGIEVKTRPYQQGDEKHLSAILKKIYHQDFNDDYWQWKYLDNPLGTHFCHCALIEDSIVGFAGGIPYRIKWEKQEITGAQITDLAIEPGLQGKKVFSPIQKANLADIKNNTDAFYGFTNENSYRVYKNFDFAFRVPRMVKVLNTTALLKQRLPGALARMFGMVGNIGLDLAGRIRCAGKNNDSVIRELETFDNRIDEFLDTISSSFKMMHIRDQHYLNWRYCRHPLHHHTVYAVEEEDRILGFVALRDEPETIHRGIILEFLAVPERKDIQHLLLNKTIDHFRNREVDIVVCWMFPHSPYYKVFKQHLFSDRRGDLIVLTSTTRPDEKLRNDLKNPLNWYITCGDDESF